MVLNLSSVFWIQIAKQVSPLNSLYKLYNCIYTNKAPSTSNGAKEKAEGLRISELIYSMAQIHFQRGYNKEIFSADATVRWNTCAPA